MRLPWLISFLIIFCTNVLGNPDTLSKEYLLIDSVPLHEFTKNDKELLFKQLKLFHTTQNDTVKVKALESLCENLYHPVWEKYEHYLFDFLKLKLKEYKNNSQILPRLQKSMSDALNNIGYINTQKGNFDTAISFFKESIKYSNIIDNEKGTSDTYNNIGYIYNLKGITDSTIKYYNIALKIRKKYNDTAGIANSYNNFGYLYYRLGHISMALEYFFKGLKIREMMNDREGMSNIYNNIGNIFKELNELDKALEYFLKTLDLKLDINNKLGVAGSYKNIGAVYYLKKDFKNALNYYNKTLKLFKEIDKKTEVADCYNKIAQIYVHRNKYREALNYLFNALEITKQTDDKTYLPSTYYNIAIVYFNEKKLNLSESYALKSYEAANEIKNAHFLEQSYELLSNINKEKNNWQRAYGYYKKYIEIRDKTVNEKNRKKLIQKDLKYKFEKEREIQAKEFEKKLAIEQAQKEKQRILLYSSVLGLLLVIIFSSAIYNRLRITRKQKHIIEKQKQVVEQKNREITDSIQYAKRLQNAILPTTVQISTYLPQSFIFFKPKDIVSGDFYWLEIVENYVFFAAADCTGHGVPGAMVSVVCSNALSKVVIEEKELLTDKILNRVRTLIIERFARSGENIYDGMDISLCRLNKDTLELQWSGANNSLYIIRNNELIEIKADKQPVGKSIKHFPFTAHTVQLQKGDTIYLFTDGFADQFGGPKGKKFKYKPFKELLLSIQNQSMEQQREKLYNTFTEWKGHLEQVDDVCIFGVRVA